MAKMETPAVDQTAGAGNEALYERCIPTPNPTAMQLSGLTSWRGWQVGPGLEVSPILREVQHGR
jgi:hypothetical protein